MEALSSDGGLAQCSGCACQQLWGRLVLIQVRGADNALWGFTKNDVEVLLNGDQRVSLAQPYGSL
jgi:hypothetical protein